VLADNQRIFDQNFFRTENFNVLKCVHVSSDLFDVSMNDDVYAFLQDIPEYYWQTYDIDYEKKYNITLYPKKQGKDKIVCVTDEKNFFDKAKLVLAHNTDFFATLHWIRHYLVDTRFDNRVIVRPLSKKTFEQVKNKNRGMG
jgi:hypothetical protein